MSMKFEKPEEIREKNISNAVDTVNLPRHRWYYYKEGFSPNLVEKAISELHLDGTSLVIDPFNGSGTVTLTCAMKGIPSVGVEVNPFTAFIAKTKTLNVDADHLNDEAQKLIKSIEEDRHTQSRWIGKSTFTEHKGIDKWLFNLEVANAYESGFLQLGRVESPEINSILKLTLISSLMNCCNARRDGKCFKYKINWKENKKTKADFLQALANNIAVCVEDVKKAPILTEAKIENTDSRRYFEETVKDKYSLCITSPPYLNTFDYTDIYRPELFLGGFIADNPSLYNLRLNTIRSHVQALWPTPKENKFGNDYERVMKHILTNQDKLMSKRIPLMVQAYFEDMQKIMSLLWKNAQDGAQVWFVVSTSAYAGIEVPVDVIIGEIGERAGFVLQKITKLRDIRKRKTKYSGNIEFLRESLVVLSK